MLIEEADSGGVWVRGMVVVLRDNLPLVITKSGQGFVVLWNGSRYTCNT